MKVNLPVWKKFFYSRKFWSFAVGLVTLVSASLEDGTFTSQEVQAISALLIGYIFSVALEDGLSNINPPKVD